MSISHTSTSVTPKHNSLGGRLKKTAQNLGTKTVLSLMLAAAPQLSTKAQEVQASIADDLYLVATFGDEMQRAQGGKYERWKANGSSETRFSVYKIINEGNPGDNPELLARAENETIHPNQDPQGLIMSIDSNGDTDYNTSRRTFTIDVPKLEEGRLYAIGFNAQSTLGSRIGTHLFMRRVGNKIKLIKIKGAWNQPDKSIEEYLINHISSSDKTLGNEQFTQSRSISQDPSYHEDVLDGRQLKPLLSDEKNLTLELIDIDNNGNTVSKTVPTQVSKNGLTFSMDNVFDLSDTSYEDVPHKTISWHEALDAYSFAGDFPTQATSLNIEFEKNDGVYVADLSQQIINPGGNPQLQANNLPDGVSLNDMELTIDPEVASSDTFEVKARKDAHHDYDVFVVSYTINDDGGGTNPSDPEVTHITMTKAHLGHNGVIEAADTSRDNYDSYLIMKRDAERQEPIKQGSINDGVIIVDGLQGGYILRAYNASNPSQGATYQLIMHKD